MLAKVTSSLKQAELAQTSFSTQYTQFTICWKDPAQNHPSIEAKFFQTVVYHSNQEINQVVSGCKKVVY